LSAQTFYINLYGYGSRQNFDGCSTTKVNLRAAIKDSPLPNEADLSADLIALSIIIFAIRTNNCRQDETIRRSHHSALWSTHWSSIRTASTHSK
jgi:hypothetical protein